MKWKSIAFSIIVVLLLACACRTMLLAQTPRDNQLFKVRNSVWRAWFSNDVKVLHALVPANTIVIGAANRTGNTKPKCSNLPPTFNPLETS